MGTAIAVKGEMAVLNQEGDTRVTWDSSNPTEVRLARDQFKKFKDEGFAAFSVKGDGGKGEQIRSFDPEAERIILVPPRVGG